MQKMVNPRGTAGNAEEEEVCICETLQTAELKVPPVLGAINPVQVLVLFKALLSVRSILPS